MPTLRRPTADELRRALNPKALGVSAQPQIVEIAVEERPDSNGVDSLFISIIFDDATDEDSIDFASVAPIEAKIEAALTAAGDDRFAYFLYRRASESSVDEDE